MSPPCAPTPPVASEVIHFNNAGCGLLAAPVLATMLDHLNLEARIGGYEASAARADEVREFYDETAALINCAPRQHRLRRQRHPRVRDRPVLDPVRGRRRHPHHAKRLHLQPDRVPVAAQALRRTDRARARHARGRRRRGGDGGADAGSTGPGSSPPPTSRPTPAWSSRSPRSAGTAANWTCSTWSTPASRSASTRSTSPRSAATC